MAPHSWPRDAPLWPVLSEMYLPGSVCERGLLVPRLRQLRWCSLLLLREWFTRWHAKGGAGSFIPRVGKSQMSGMKEDHPLEVQTGSTWAVHRLLGKVARFTQGCGWQSPLPFRMGSLTLALDVGEKRTQ